MRIQLTRATSFFLSLLFLFALYACGDGKGKEKDIVNEPEQMNERVRTNINELLTRIEEDGKADDSSTMSRLAVVSAFYKQSNYNPVWSSSEQFLSIADSMLLFIRQAKLYGLFPSAYHDQALKNIALRFAADTAAVADRRDAALWSKADVLLTDAFFNIVAHLHIGRLQVDSTYMNPDSVLTNQFFYTAIGQVQKGTPLSEVFHALEPAHKGYVELKEAVKHFLDSANFESQYTYVSYPYKDSIAFVKSLVRRLKEEGMLSWQLEQVDAAQLKEALTKLQTRRELTVDGKFGVQVVAYLNNTDTEKFRRIAINLDRYKVLPPQMPERYIWVNLPAYKLELWDMDTIRLESKVVVGKPNTRTPLLTSRISDMVTYPQWTIPNSIIMKEIVPALRRDPGYLAKKGYSLLTWEGEEIDPYTVDWNKYKKGIPYKVVQGSGDANALGILKFNFPNKYSVYLHDTNQRYLFKNEKRALSHGCVRVQEWEKLTYYISALDSTNFESDPKRVVSDSIKVWLQRKEKHVVRVKTPLPVYFRYFTVTGKKGKLFFYDDIYHEDKMAREASFSTK